MKKSEIKLEQDCLIFTLHTVQEEQESLDEELQEEVELKQNVISKYFYQKRQLINTLHFLCCYK